MAVAQELAQIPHAESLFYDGAFLGEMFVIIRKELDLRIALAPNNLLNFYRCQVMKEPLDPKASTVSLRNGYCEIPVSRNHTLSFTSEQLEPYSVESPYKTGNPSEAIYLAKFKTEKGEVLIQYMHPNSRASHHSHDVEIYNPFTTGGFLWLDQEKVLQLDTRFTVQKGQTHMAFTFDEPSISLIIAEGDIYHDQVPGEKPTIEFLRKKAQELGIIIPNSQKTNEVFKRQGWDNAARLSRNGQTP